MVPLNNPRRLIFIGGALLIIGWILPLLTVLNIIDPSFAVLFVGYGMSVAGLVTGLVGVYTYFPFSRRK